MLFQKLFQLFKTTIEGNMHARACCQDVILQLEKKTKHIWFGCQDLFDSVCTDLKTLTDTGWPKTLTDTVT